MSFFDKVLHRVGLERRNAIDPSWAAMNLASGFPSLVSSRVAENLSSVFACATAISTAIAAIPAIVYRREGENRIEDTRHPLAKMVRQGWNDSMTWPDAMEHLIASTLLTGNGLAQQLRNDQGRLTGLRYIPWHWVTVSELQSGRLAYDVSDGKGKTWRLLEGEVIHLRDRTDDGKIGRSRLSRAANTVEAVSTSNDFARNFLRNGAQPGGIIEAPGMLSPEQKAALREQVQKKYAGPNVGSTMLLDGGLKWTSVQISPEDAELLETRKFGVEEICRLFQVPPPLVQDYSHNTFTNSETAGRWFAMFCLTPWARKIEAEFARSIFPSNGSLELELDLSGFLRGDPATRWQAHAIALSNGVLDPDEVRQVEGWNPRGAAQV